MADDVTSTVVGKVMDLLVGAAKREIGYMWNCSENVKTFKEEVDKLTAMKDTLQGRIDVARREGKDPGKDLIKWTNDANVKISQVTKLINEEDEFKKTCCNCVNLGTIYRYGKMATKETCSLLKHQQDGEGFKNRVFDPLPTSGFTDLYQTKDLENIDTHKSTLQEIIEAIEDVTIQIVGIIGIGGVGKTTLAGEVAVKMKNKFADIVFITVSRTVDAKIIQEKVQVAARRIINGEKVLIILDDVWEELKLDEVGIPCGSRYMNCKILLTSRSKDVCEAMDANLIKLNPLKEKEAWALFENVVGTREWDAKVLKQVALDIVKECDGLPLFIQAVGKALRNKEIKSWEAALDRLRDPTDEDIPFKRNEIMQLKLSYDFLESEVAKSCFLLCSMFPEDGTIGIKRLAYYGLALEIFNNPDTGIQEAKHRVRVAVDSLQSSFLLLPERNSVYGEEKEEELLFKMHDLVRDMAMIITSKGNDKFWVRSGTGLSKWHPTKHLENYNKISLTENRIFMLPDHELLFPHLDTFLIRNNLLSVVHDEFFRGMEKLKVLDMSGNEISSLPQSLKYLTKLRTLDLSRSTSLCEISILGELTSLEILQLRGTGITNIPKEIGHLTNLRLLDVYSCEDLSYVTPGVVLKLIRLEELYVGLKEGDCSFLLELSESLKILHLKVPGLRYIPEDLRFETLIEVLIEDNFYDYPTHDCKPILHISKISFPLTMSVIKLIQASEMLILWNIEDLNSVLPDLYPEGCDKLKYIELGRCENVRSLVTSNELGQKRVFSQVEKIELYYMNRLELLWDMPHQYISCSNLSKIKIEDCPSLLALFPLSVAQRLVNLKILEIRRCKSLAVVISDEQTFGSENELVKHDTDIVFPIKRILLDGLSKLESFYSGHSIIKYPHLKFIIVDECRSMKRWSYGENHIANITFHHEGRLCNINDYIAAQLEVDKDISIFEHKYSSRDTDTEGHFAQNLRRRQARGNWISGTEKMAVRAMLRFLKAGEQL